MHQTTIICIECGGHMCVCHTSVHLTYVPLLFEVEHKDDQHKNRFARNVHVYMSPHPSIFDRRI